MKTIHFKFVVNKWFGVQFKIMYYDTFPPSEKAKNSSKTRLKLAKNVVDVIISMWLIKFDMEVFCETLSIFNSVDTSS